MKWISVDAMGGDIGPAVTVSPCLELLQENPSLGFILTGTEHLIRDHLGGLSDSLSARLKVRHTSETVTMSELPSVALRNKKDSSMRVALDLLKSGDAHACVSAGNTGALMATAKFVLKTIPGISRPAILTRMPNMEGSVTRVLDLGANVDCSPEQLVQFAIMGAVVSKAVGGVSDPRVGLLNVGQEEIKGNVQIKQAAAMLTQIDNLNYVGFVEGNDWFSGRVDVVVCDGLVGNIALKAVEGVATFISRQLVGGFKQNIYSQLSGLLAKPVLKKFKETADPRSYNGAVLVGLNGVVVKSHGSADQLSFRKALDEAVLGIDNHIPSLIGQYVESAGLK